ncbi:MAG: mechanosensitive ion channel family protein [Planctomycetaceae bacterium]|nr:mechanosensitive ion channel family protein [Planctomycetaceae bacterium]
MTSREKMLIGAVAAAGALWFGTQGLTRYREAVDRHTNLQLEAERALSEARTAELRGQRARKQVNEWRNQSLPTNREVAESLYQDWLRAQLTGAGMTVTQIADKSGSARNPQFAEVAVEVRAEGSLAQLADFLHRFYSGPHLHRISTATITAADGGQKLTCGMTATALILPDAKRTDKLAEGEPQPIEGVKSLDEVRQRLTDRNLFVAHAPKSGGEASVDTSAAEAEFTGAVYGSDGWQSWVRNKTSGAVSRFEVGDAIEFGTLKGKVVEIEDRRMVIETEKGRVELRAGQNFSQTTLLAPPAA